MSQYIVAAFLDGTLVVRASGPFRSHERAAAACDLINDAGGWTEDDPGVATILAQVVKIEPVRDLVGDAKLRENSGDADATESSGPA